MAEFSVKKISPKLGGERGTRNPNGPTSSHDLVEQMEFLYVKVIKAINNSVLNPITHTCYPIVEITLGNYKASTKDLPMGPLPNREWNQVFAFDKSKGDVLSVTLKDGQFGNNTLIGKQNFKLAADIPSRVPPDAPLAPQWYSMQTTEDGYHMALLMSVWFGTQADAVYSNAWFSDAYDVSASCVINTRPKIYQPPRLCYVRVTIVSGHDLISHDGIQTPNVYVKATLGQVSEKTLPKSGSNPSWNQDLIFVASDRFEGTVEISLIDKIDNDHEVCIGKLKKKLSEMTAVKVPGAAPALPYPIEPAGTIEPAGDTSRFTSKITMRLATDQSYHVFDECIQYCSDYRAFAPGLWPGKLGKLEVGILSATGLTPMKNATRQRNAYVVAKYGDKWARTRTVVDNACPKWNEQYWWDIYEKCTVITLGVYDNRQIFSNYRGDDVPIGKVRIPLNLLKWNVVYTGSFPVIVLGKEGLKKMGEIQLAFRCSGPPPTWWLFPPSYAFVKASFELMLPKSHYKSPLSLLQIEALRALAVDVNCMNLARTEPPLRNEVVKDMLKPKSKSYSMRRAKANYERLYKIVTWLLLSGPCGWVKTKIISTTDYTPKVSALLFGLFCIFFPNFIWWLAVCLVIPCCLAVKVILEVKILFRQGYNRMRNIVEKPPPLVLVDLKLSKLDPPVIEELDDEFCPLSEVDVKVLKERYKKLRENAENVVMLMGEAASQFERLYALWILLCDLNPVYKIGLCLVSYCVVLFVYYIPYQVWLVVLLVYCLRFRLLYNDLPTAAQNFFRRLPTNEDLLL